jgi:hypothetical protein
MDKRLKPDQDLVIHTEWLAWKGKLFANMLEAGYDLRLQVTGRSMTPFLETGSFVTLSKIPLSKLRIGDILFCRCDDGSCKLHRLIQRDGD